MLPLRRCIESIFKPANKTAYLEIIEVLQKIAEDKYEGYYLVRTKTGTYISGMQEEQYATLKEELGKR